MKTIPLKSLQDQPGLYHDIAKVLDADGLVCVPCGGAYRIVANHCIYLTIIKSRKEFLSVAKGATVDTLLL